ENDPTTYGWNVFLDSNGNGYCDKDITGVYETACIADSEGQYYFDNLTIGKEYTLNIVLPKEYSITVDSPSQLPYVFTFDGTPLEFNFEIAEN
ncbi:MAG: hypothetical protein GY834_08555, partial [Bacteroidetes bacterium]|nr:hypothetical protein [Bacteroidota bacterium]